MAQDRARRSRAVLLAVALVALACVLILTSRSLSCRTRRREAAASVPEPPTGDAPPPVAKLDPLADDRVEAPGPKERPVEEPPPPVPEGRRLTAAVFAARSAGGRARAARAPGGPTAESEAAVTAGLEWLAKAQEDDGRWGGQAWGQSAYDVGLTGLALLAFQGAGHSESKGIYKQTIRRGLVWLATQQEPDGRFRYQTFYEQGIATMALCEAYGLTRSPAVGRMAQRAVDYLCKVQPEHGGFRYQGAVVLEHGDLCCSGWQMMAMALGRCAELDVPDQAFERSRVLLRNTWRGNGASAYLVGTEAPGSLTVSSIGLLARAFLGDEAMDEEVQEAAQLLFDKETRDGQPVPGGATGQLARDLYYAYWSSLAMRQAGGRYWTVWSEMVRDPLLAAQVQEERDGRGRFIRGSWDPARDKFGKGVGRVYTTALAVLCLETPYRYARVYPKAIEPPAEF